MEKKGKHYEEKFEFSLWKLIKDRAEKKDISYARAAEEVVPEYVKTIRYRDVEFEDAAIGKRAKEKIEVAERYQLQKSREAKNGS